MTIAIGLLASDGIVVAADTQVTIGDSKTAMGKIGAAVQYRDDVLGSCVVAGAGSVTHMNSCSQTMISTFMRRAEYVGDDLRAALVEDLETFHQSHIIPFAQFPDHERPFVEFLVAYQRDGRRAIWQTDRTVVQKAEPYAAIGHGQQQALSILGRLYRLPMLDVWETTVMAFYVLAQVKDSDIYCGGRSQVFSIQANRFREVPRKLAARIDGAMGRFGKVIEANTFRAVVGGRPSEAAPQENEVRGLFAAFVDELRSADLTDS